MLIRDPRDRCLYGDQDRPMLKTSIMTSIETSSAIGTETGCDTATER